MFRRVFVGIPIRFRVARACLTALPMLPVSRDRLLAVQKWHITLAFLGPCPDGALRSAVGALRRELCSWPSVVVHARAVRVLSPRTGLLALELTDHDELAVLAQAVRNTLRTIPALPRVHGHGHTDFVPHITIGRNLPLRMRDATRLRRPVLIPVHDVVVYESTLDPSGAQYRALATIRLSSS